MTRGASTEHTDELASARAEKARLAAELTAARHQQAATADLLRLISSSRGDLEPVFQALLSSATRLCEADFGILYGYQDGKFRADALVGAPERFAAWLQEEPRSWDETTALGRIVQSRRPVRIDDVRGDALYRQGHPLRVAFADMTGARSFVAVPMLRDDDLVGSICIYRREMRPFTDEQLGLVSNFADQAVIAIENTRLLSELTQSLQQQTATADVLKVISRSAFDLKAVLTTLVQSARELCDAPQGMLLLRDGDVYRTEMQLGYPPEFERYILNHPIVPSPNSGAGRAAFTGKVAHFPDVLADPEYRLSEGQRLGRYRALLSIPLLREGEVIGVFSLGRHEPGAFTPRQIQLLQTFADQAVIAIENARLFHEVEARTGELSRSLQQQTATADVLKVISRSAFDLRAVLDTLIASATQLCGAEMGLIFLMRDGLLYPQAEYGTPPGYLDFMAANPMKPGRETFSGRAALTGAVVNVADALEDPEHRFAEARDRAGYRAMLAVPLLREGEVIGVLSMPRSAPGRFTDREVDLVQTFADQAVIAIENVRLFDEVQARTTELSEALQQQTATAEVLKVISRSTFDLQTVLDTLVESAAGLCEADQACVFQRKGELYHWVSNFGFSPDLVAYAETHPFAAGPHSTTSRVALEARVIHNPDVLADPEYKASEHQRLGNYRTMLGVPLLREGSPVGVFILTRQKVRPFTDRQIELVTSFADQAVIAIENVRLFDEVQARTRELQQSLEYQTATADVLSAISRSPDTLQPVLDTIVATAGRVCQADDSHIYMLAAGAYHMAACINPDDEWVRHLAATPLSADTRGSITARAARELRTIHVPDTASDPEGDQGLLGQQARRTIISVPLVRDGVAVGVITLNRRVVNPFTPVQIELLTTFADQAVIAIQNVRLYEEVQARTREVQESLEYQTATSDILSVISRSPSQLTPVLDTIVDTALRLCDAYDALLLIREGEVLASVAHRGPLPTAQTVPVDRESVAGRAAADAASVHVHDLLAQEEQFPRGYALAKEQGLRTVLASPLKRGDAAIGVLVIRRTEMRPFSDKQVAVLQTFANQAVIAIENVRLFDEVQARTTELSDLLEQQTATADILKVIASSPSAARPVFQAIAERSNRLVSGLSTAVFSIADDQMYLEAFTRTNPEADAALQAASPFVLSAYGWGEEISRGEIVRFLDTETDVRVQPTLRELARMRGYRSMLLVPLLRDRAPIGMISVTRVEPGPFAEAHVDLLQTFADQAVIAIENARLFEEVQGRTRELQNSLEYQTATSDVLSVISRSAFDLQTVLDTLVESATRLCGAEKGVIFQRGSDDAYRIVSVSGYSRDMVDYSRENPLRPGLDSTTGRVALEGKTVHEHDVLANPDYKAAGYQKIGGYRTSLGVPLLRDGTTIGVFVLTRPVVQPFTEKQIELVTTFADQAVIAIENARLFEEVQDRTRDLSASLEDLRKAQDRLVQTEKLASLGQLTAGIAHEIKNPLNFVNNFADLSTELVDELKAALDPAPLDDSTREEVDELSGMLRENLKKVVEHGRRADSIVKNMLLHSREGSTERRTVDLNATAEESLNLAYHGARAENPAFRVSLHTKLDPDTGYVDLYPQEFVRVLLNLISNGFYAAHKRKQQVTDETFEPTLTLSTAGFQDRVEIRVRDNGTGIAEDVKAKVFNPFFTTKPAGEGTGLGLSLSHDIVVKQHGGTLHVDTRVGEFTEFVITLPRSASALPKQRSLP